jgi:hypothetical protein
MSLTLSRRRMLGLLGTAGAAAGLPASTALAAGEGVTPLALADARLLARRPKLAAQLFGGRAPEMLGQEPVRAWRDGLGRRVAGCGAVGLVCYDQFLLLRDLARESRLAVKTRALGGGAFRIAIDRQA